ncbi:MAG: glycosyltransferase family 4 protein [Candidatus Pacebacteria bacterium]|nr:glycosyltransferase family 4 protein [Candidatus Paceibacterota bacterium]
MNIGFFTDTYTPQVNGVVVSLDIFKKELEKQGHTVHIFAPTAPGYKSGTDKAKNITRFKSFKFIIRPELRVAIPFSWKILKEIPKLKLDIIHSHTPFNLGVLALIISRLQNIPLVYTYHTFYSEFIKYYLWKGKVITPKMIERMTTFYCNRCQTTIIPSLKMEKTLYGIKIKRGIKVLSTGVDLDRFKHIPRNNFRKKYNICPKARVLIFVGRFAGEKNIEFLIRATKEISLKVDNIHLLLVGDGHYKKRLITLINNLKIKERVSFTGFISREEVAKAYQSSDVFVFSSKTETQGLVVLEAAASGLPIVLVKDLAFKDVLINGVNGYETEEEIGEYSNMVIKVLEDKKNYKKMSYNSKIIAENFDISKQTERLVNLYSELCLDKKQDR